jgi:vancomycin resistance protein YoaR
VTDQPFREKNNDRRVAAWLLFGLVVLFGGLYVAGYLFTSDRVPRGTTVSGVDIGGLRPAAAEAELTEGLSGRAEQPIVVSADGSRIRIQPEEAGLAVDITRSVEQAGGGRSWNPARMWDYFSGGDDFEAVVTIDTAKLDRVIAGIAEGVDRPAKEGRVTFVKDRARPRLPSTGVAVDQPGAASAVADAYLESGDVVPLPVDEVVPEITESEVRAAMEDFANPAVSAPVIIELAGRNIVVRPAAYSIALSLQNQDGSLVPVLDGKALMKAIQPAMSSVALQPRDAEVRLIDGRPTVVRGKDGVTFDPKDITDQFLSIVTERGKNRTIAVKSVVDKPEFSTADARKLKIEEVVSSFTTHYPHADYRNTNLGRAAELVSGTVLKPGETFSLNDTVGERTESNGFTEGFIISNGVFKEDLGGGVSQVATTLFNAAFFAGLEDVEHKPHSFYIDRYPIGREATVAWGAVDLRFKNDTPYGVLIEAWIDPSTPSSQGAMNVRMWSTKYWDIRAGVSERYNFTEEDTRYITDEDCVPNDGYGGFDIDVFRYFYRPGSETLERKETMHTTYIPSDTVVCGRDPNA